MFLKRGIAAIRGGQRQRCGERATGADGGGEIRQVAQPVGQGIGAGRKRARGRQFVERPRDFRLNAVMSASVRDEPTPVRTVR